MATKTEEIKALEQIRKIIEGLGEDSYVGKAFEGCVQDAEENINDDFWNSYKDRYEKADREAWEAQREAKDSKEAYNELLKTHEREIKERDEKVQYFRQMFDQAVKLAEEERKDVTVEMKDGFTKGFKSLRYINNNGFQFIIIEEKNGWCNSYKLDEIESFVIE